MKIKIMYYKQNTQREQITKTAKILNAVQNYFFFELNVLENDFYEDEMFCWDSFSESHDDTDSDEYLIYITEKQFYDNWFSHEERHYSVITTHDWNEIYAPPSVSAYLVYQIAQSAINFRADLSENMAIRMVHDRAIGCMFDFCQDKPDLKLGMVSGTICSPCKGTLSRLGVDENALKSIERMLNYVRSEAIGKPIIFNENEAFIVMSFSTNDENDNAYKFGIKSALKELNITCSRADDIITSNQLLDKINLKIVKSRFIIAKIDSENLNVYFELGLALGSDKDILLVCEENFISQLPSDLRNWECLTYTKGNYDGLKNKIIKYYRSNYHYPEGTS